MKILILGLILSLFSINETKISEEIKKVDDFVCQTWAHVSVECGNDFWLCTDGQTEEEIDADVWRFSEHRCD